MHCLGHWDGSLPAEITAAIMTHFRKTGSFLLIVLEWFDFQLASFVLEGHARERCPGVIFTKPHFPSSLALERR